jgi:transcriptional regulator GlxA family with amidase domain
MTKRIGFIGYQDVQGLDLVAPLEAFATANDVLGVRAYAPMIVNDSGKPFRSETHITLSADTSFREAPAFDTIILPGGAGLRAPEVAKPVVAWLKQRARSTRRIASVCTGLEALAQTGLVDGRRVTTHWRFAKAMAGRYPKLIMEADAIYLRDGKFYTSGGLTAGIDLSLALIAEDFGEKTALTVARELVVYLKRSGGQAQYSEPLQFQSRGGDDFQDLATWMLNNLRSDLSVPVLAARTHLGPRHFSRRFAAAFGMPPAEYVTRLRLDAARRRLGARNQTIDSVAASVGYASADAFRRAFERRFGLSPGAYEKQFGK